MAEEDPIPLDASHRVTSEPLKEEKPYHSGLNPARGSPTQQAGLYLQELLICMCLKLCTIVVHSTAPSISDNLPSYPPDNHHSSDGGYRRAGGFFGAF